MIAAFTTDFNIQQRWTRFICGIAVVSGIAIPERLRRYRYPGYNFRDRTTLQRMLRMSAFINLLVLYGTPTGTKGPMM